MFKRANKVTALLVAAASIMSIVPAMATTRIGTRDGHITGEAIAYDGGKYAYEGYRTTDDDNGIYYNDGSATKEKFNEDLRDYTLTSKYGTKYAYATDNNDQYLVDLTTGKIVDTETPEDKADQIKSDLKSKLKRTDRYSKTGSWDTISLGDSYEKERYNDNTRLFGNKFGEVWYAYVANGDKDATDTQAGQVATKASFTVKLPTTLDTYTIPGTTKSYGTAGTSLSALRADMLTKITADIKANYSNTFDYTTVQIVGNTIVGYAKTTGEIAKDNTELVAFANAYGVAASLAGSVTTATDTATAAQLALGTLSTVSTSNSSVATASNDSGTVTILKGNVGKTTITVKDTAAKVATISVEVTSAAGVKTMTSTVNPYVASEVVAAAVATITAGNGTATFADYQNAGLTDLVSNAASRTKLTFGEANTVVKNYIASGVISLSGGTISDITALKDVLQKGLDLKLKNQMDTDAVVINRGLNQVGGSLGDPGRYVGFVSESGKYVDVSNLANIYVYSKVAQKTVKVKEYNKVNADYNITVGLQSITALAQDKDYIYTLTQVGVVEGSNAVETQYFIQKISKAQGETKDGAYIPKSVDSYQVDNKTIFDNGDSQVIYNLLVNHLEDGFALDNVSAKDGALYITGVKNDGDHDKVKVFKAALKKDKIDTISTYGQGTKKDADVYIAKKDADTDIDVNENTRDTAVAYDIDGNTWVINKGTITKITGTDKKDMFTCDHSFHNLDVYNDSNVIAWDKDSDFYTNVAEGTKVTQGESTAVAPVIVTGWVKGTDGTWTFNDATGTKVVNKWQNLGGVWYFLKADGIMATGWYNDNGTWYYLNGSGAMQTGWLNDNGTWYYLAGSGAMLANTTVDGYVLGASGAWVK